MARRPKVETHEAPPATWEEPTGNKPLSESLSAPVRYKEYDGVSFKQLVDAYENQRVALEWAIKRLLQAEAIIASEHLHIRDVLDKNKVT